GPSNYVVFDNPDSLTPFVTFINLSSLSAPTNLTLTLTASGVSNTVQITVVPANERSPIAEISNLKNDSSGEKPIPVVTTGVLNVIGTAADPNPAQAVSYQLSLWKQQADNLQFLANLTTNISATVTEGTLANVDLSRYRNGLYVLRLLVTDAVSLKA